jgi:NADH dehydrogenase
MSKFTDRRMDSYSLKNAALSFKLLATGGMLGSAALLAWSWYVSLSVLTFNRPSDMCLLLGDDLWALAHNKAGLFWTLVFFQAVAYAGMYFTSKMLFKRSALRRRMKTFLVAVTTFLVVLDQVVWFSAPFFRVSQHAVGYVGLGSAIALIGLSLPPLFQMWFYPRWTNTTGKKRVVVVGGGFAGLYAAMGLDKALGYHQDLEITLIDQKNYFLFPPLLPSASVGTIETRQVTYPYRRILETTNIFFKRATVTGVDPKAKKVLIHVDSEGDHDLGAMDSQDLGLRYDYLVLAPGSVTQTFGTKGAEDHAIFVRELSDAIKIRSRIIDCFERAAVVEDPVVQRELVRFAVVGGGPTGVEIATEIQDLIHEVLLKRYPEIDPSWVEVSIIQSGPQVLPGWPETVVRRSTAQLKRLGIKLVLNNRVMEVRSNAVVLKEGEPVAARTILWCAGVQPSPLMKACGLALDKSNRAPINSFLRAEGFDDVFVLGDAASCVDPKTQKTLPPLGQVAFQQGDYMAKTLVNVLRGDELKPFRYFNFGSLVSVGEHYAAVDLLGVKLSGFIGWFVWRTLYLSKIIGFSNRIRIMLDWTLDLLIERSISQLQDHPHTHRK